MHEKRNKFLVYGCMMMIVFLSSFRAPDLEVALNYAVPGYIQIIQNLSVPLVLLCMLLSIFLMVNVESEYAETSVSLTFCFFIFQVIILLTEFSRQNNLADFSIRLLFSTVTFFYFLKVVGKLSLYKAKGSSVLKAFFWGSFAFICLNLLLYKTGLATVMWKGRLFGLTAHPNFLGICAAIETVLALLFFIEEKNWKNRTIYLAGAGLGAYVCLLTLSRTSMLGVVSAGFAFSFVAMKNSSFKPFFMILMVLVSVMLIANITADSLDYADRGNTREQTWKELYEDVAKLPIVGKGRTGASTNAYMFAIVAGGLVGAIFFYRSLFGAMASAYRDLLNTENFKRLAYLSILTLILVTSVFEGYLLDTISIPAFTYWMLLTVTKQLA